ncbi:MAG: hypothetical protein HN846_01710 [Candidatus Pacebacteria bacterium]|jgi:hypothetical protein|nr:hypothetical protein [Candidatus Paceibacterota bacterium]MBT3511590.1 hypothetical protein [Candidatus Paceibacterota bacterium]MBT4004940.1 hypothetical protein [Candidatus Paceibacterota bacterium]MBT4358716.1 hypothetical protein [Candidatus Paceibacterota bacterium]MBT4680683.1 hypothetical protein [Candidatus Paceibacterota bacterium]
MLDERFIILGAVLSFFGGLSYIIDTIKGKNKPNRVTWFFWAIAPLIAFFAELEKGVGLQSLMTFMAGFNPLLIFIASFVNKKAYWKLDNRDYLFGFLALLGIIIWQVTGDGNLGILFAILADGFAAIPTLIKSYFEPKTESSLIFLLGINMAGITLLTIEDWNFAHWGFPVYILLVNILIVLLVKFKLGLIIQRRIAEHNSR